MRSMFEMTAGPMVQTTALSARGEFVDLRLCGRSESPVCRSCAAALDSEANDRFGPSASMANHKGSAGNCMATGAVALDKSCAIRDRISGRWQG